VVSCLPGTMALRVETPLEVVRPGHRDMCAVVGTAASVGVNSVQPDMVVETVKTLPWVATGTVVKMKGASNRRQAPVASAKAWCPNHSTLVGNGAGVPKTRTKVSSVPVTTRRKPSEVVPRKLLDNRNLVMSQQRPQDHSRSRVQSGPPVTFAEVHQEDTDSERESVSDVSGEG